MKVISVGLLLGVVRILIDTELISGKDPEKAANAVLLILERDLAGKFPNASAFVVSRVQDGSPGGQTIFWCAAFA